MAGTGISESILFSAAIVLAIAFVGVFVVIIAGAGSDLEEHGDRVSQSMRTDVVLLNDADAMSTSPLVLYAKNTGDTELNVADVSVTLDGEFSSDLSLDVLGSTDDATWQPGEILQITVNDLSVTSGSHQVRLITGPGTHTALTFDA